MRITKLPRWAIVVDIETMDTRITARVASIGAVVVDTHELKIVGGTTFRPRLDDQIWRTQSDDTMKFWAAQSESAKFEVFGAFNRISVVDTFIELNKFVRSWVGPSKDVTCSLPSDREATWWGYGPAFDLVVLEDLAREFGAIVPWTYRQHRDLRTLYDLADVDLASHRLADDIPHSAIDDASCEARAMIAALLELGFLPKRTPVDDPVAESAA